MMLSSDYSHNGVSQRHLSRDSAVKSTNTNNQSLTSAAVSVSTAPERSPNIQTAKSETTMEHDAKTCHLLRYSYYPLWDSLSTIWNYTVIFSSHIYPRNGIWILKDTYREIPPIIYNFLHTLYCYLSMLLAVKYSPHINAQNFQVVFTV